ncbi:hypothetical protein EC957_003442 [Mortierella hygrophila]|uniref:Uncharacterized protein n=1 Tax=Mortierella hygrophila TaxID=979708 RepID=A0A9P6K0U5_9FUNG|nr:hypothetical protein EC957_003442 [Mortierella hygrophila]
MTMDTSATEETKDTKASKVPGSLDKATGKRKKKRLDLPVQSAPRRLTPKKIVTNTNTKAEVSLEQQEQEENETKWIWGCAVEKPGEHDVTQEERDSTSSGHVVKELRQACRKVKITPSAQYNRESETISTNTEDQMQDKKRSDHAVNDSNNEENKDGHKEQNRFNGECYDKTKEQEPDNTLVREEGQRVTEEERKKKLRKRLQKDLEKGLRTQKNLHMKLHSQLRSQKDLELMKAILTELEKGLKLQKMVENELGLKKMQGKGLDEPDLHSAEVYTEEGVATRVLPLLADLQVLAA